MREYREELPNLLPVCKAYIITRDKDKRSDLIETFKIMNRHYNINRDLFFQLDGGRRGHG